MDKPEIAIAFDRGDLTDLDALLKRAEDLADYVKLGPSVFLKLGEKSIQHCLAHGIRVFLDLKLHDIPFQVGGAIESAAKMGVSLMTVHNSGGPAMLADAAKAGRDAGVRIVGVNVLTSLRNEDVDLVYNTDPTSHSITLSGLAEKQGLDGIVCSGLELEHLRPRFPKPFLMVVPGLRFEGDMFGDQQRVVDPYQAVRLGADILVLGRSVTMTAGGWDRLKAFKEWIDQQAN